MLRQDSEASTQCNSLFLFIVYGSKNYALKCIENKANPTEACPSSLSVIYSLLAMANMTWTALKHAIARSTSPWRRMHICCSQKRRSCRQFRRHGVSLVDPNKVPSPPKLKHETLIHQWSFFYQFFNVKPPLLKTFRRRFCMWNAALKTSSLTLASCGVLYLHNSVTFPKLVRLSGSNESL